MCRDKTIAEECRVNNRARLWLITIITGSLLGLSCGPAADIAGSGTETGNVTGTVFTSALAKVAGAKISLFKKKSEITSPDENSVPIEETYTNDTGYFSFKVDNGNYTIVAALDSQFAFHDSIIPGNVKAKDIKVVLETPGTIKGEIINSLELRGTGSIVVHLTGTSIFKNVETDGTFLIDNVPVGKYTLISYSTYQPEFSPNYKQVTVLTDSITDLGRFSLTYNGIPIPKNIKVVYDTAHEVVRISWDSIKNYKDFQEYAVLRGLAGQTEHNLKQVGYTKDTVFIDSVNFTSEQPVKYEYCVLIHNKLGEAGKYYGIYSTEVMPYKNEIPKIDTLKMTFDTIGGVVNLTWDSVATSEAFGGYMLIRKIVKGSKYENGMDSTPIIDTIARTTKLSYADSLFKTTLSFTDSGESVVSYSICAYQKDWKLYGRLTLAKPLIVFPYYALVPVIESIRITQDTLRGTLNVAWDTLKNFSELECFTISRRIINDIAGINKSDTFSIKNTVSFIDTIYPRYVDINVSAGTTVSYAVSVKHKLWGITGGVRSQGVLIYSYKNYQPTVSAGIDQIVDISSDVVLQGTVVSNKWPITKLEWKIGEGNWVVADSGKMTFTTNSTFDRETIQCIFRATDSVGNVGLSMVNVVKQQLVVTFGNFPSKSLPAQATSTVTASAGNLLKDDKFWITGDIDYGKYAVWSTKDFNSWTVENSSPGIQNGGQLVSCNGKMYSFNIEQKSYSSIDGVSWEEITPDLPKNSGLYTMWSNVCVLNDKMYTIYKPYQYPDISSDTLCISSDGVTWTRVGLSITETPGTVVANGLKLYLVGSNYGSNKKMVSSDFGLTWTDAPMWDQDYSIFPDDYYQVLSDDSILVAYYNERPAGVKKMSMFRNGVWTNVPISSLGTSSDYYNNIFFLFKNRLMCIIRSDYSNYTIRSIKLY